MPQEWLWNDSVAMVVLGAIFVAVGWLARKAVLIVRWSRPWLEELLESLKGLIASNTETNRKLQEAADRQDRRSADQLQACEKHATTLGVVATDTKCQNLAIVELLRGARIGLQQARIEDEPRKQIEERLDEAERIIREAG